MDQMTPGGDRGLFARLSRVMGQLERLPKNGINTHFNYPFVTDSDVADSVRKALVSEGIAFLASQEDMTKDGNRTTITFKFTFACETGEQWSALWRGEAIDTQDKGIAKAATSALKYFLLKTFILSTGDDPDPDKDGADKDRTPKTSTAKTPAPVKVEAPAPTPQNGNGHKAEPAKAPTGKPASIGGSKQWKKLADALAERCPYYRMANGATNYPHMLGAAGKCGWEVVTDDNVGEVITAIEAYATTKANEEAATA